MKTACCRGRLALLIACVPLLIGMSDISRAADAGIDGIISVSPSRPGPLRKGDSTQAPAADITFVVKKDGKKVTSFKTDTEGHFHVSLLPGHYVVCREDPGAAIGQWQFEVNVVAGKMATVHWIGDSGMR